MLLTPKVFTLLLTNLLRDLSFRRPFHDMLFFLMCAQIFKRQMVSDQELALVDLLLEVALHLLNERLL